MRKIIILGLLAATVVPSVASAQSYGEARRSEQRLREDQRDLRAAQRYGTVGAMLAGGMVAFDRILGRKPKEQPAVVIEAAAEPTDINEGISLTLEQPDGEQLQVFAPPPGRRRSRAVRRRRPAPGE